MQLLLATLHPLRPPFLFFLPSLFNDHALIGYTLDELRNLNSSLCVGWPTRPDNSSSVLTLQQTSKNELFCLVHRANSINRSSTPLSRFFRLTIYKKTRQEEKNTLLHQEVLTSFSIKREQTASNVRIVTRNPTRTYNLKRLDRSIILEFLDCWNQKMKARKEDWLAANVSNCSSALVVE